MKIETKDTFLLILLLAVFVSIFTIFSTQKNIDTFSAKEISKSPEFQQFTNQYPEFDLLMNMIFTANKNMSLNSFEREETRKIKITNEWTYDKEVKEKDPLWLFSPNKKQAL